jgi:hypothetical protein
MEEQDLRRALYEGFEILASPVQLLDNSKWNSDVYIARELGPERVERKFSTKDQHDSLKEAVGFCFQFARNIIDGNVEGCSVEDLT